MSRFLRSAFLPQLALATILAGGALVAWAIAVGFVGIVFVENSLKSEMREQLEIVYNGQPVIQAQQQVRHQWTTTYMTLDHQVTTLNDVRPYERRIRAQPGSYSVDFIREGHLGPPGDGAFTANEATWLTIRGMNDGNVGGKYWYVLREKGAEGRTYFEGYDSKTDERIGYFGLHGFRLDVPPPDDQFLVGAALRSATAVQGADPGGVPRNLVDRNLPRVVAIVSDDQLYLVNLTTQQVKHVPLPEPVVAITVVYESRKSDDDIDDVNRVVARTPEHLLLLDQDGNTLRTLSIPAELAKKPFSISLPLGNAVILHRHHRDDTEPRLNELYWIDENDNVVRRETFTLRARDMTAASIGLAASALPSPGILTTLGYVIFHHIGPPEGEAAMAAHVNHLRLAWCVLAVVSFISAALAVVAYRRQRSFGSQGAIAWAVFVFVLGPAGYFGYLVHRRWPARENCTACGAQVPRNREECLKCRAEFPAPALVGGEVFA